MVNVRSYDPYSPHVRPADVEPEQVSEPADEKPTAEGASPPASESPARATRRASRKRRAKPASKPADEDLSAALADLDAEEQPE